MSMNLIKKTSSTHTTASKGRKIEYIVLHYTAGVSSKAGAAVNTAEYFAATSSSVSADFVVDDETIVQYNPDPANRYSWHCGGSKYKTKGGSLYGKAKNANCIGIEVCSTNAENKIATANDTSWSFSDAVVARAQELVQYLMDTYGIDADHVIRHYDVNGKPCPGIIGWNADSGDESKWTAFKAGLAHTATPTVADADSSFTVRVAISNLNIRTGPGMNYAAAGKCTGKGVFTISETKAGTGSIKGWGKLKSGAGWISLDNVLM